MRIQEKMLILPALYIIKRKGTATTSELIEELTIVFNPSGEDAEILAGRSDTKFSQKVRNLVSHRDNNAMGEYTHFVNGIYSLTEKGEEALQNRLEELNYLFSQKFEYEDTMQVASNIHEKNKRIFVYEEDITITEGKMETRISKTRTRSKALRDYAIAYYSSKGKLVCEVCGFSFEDKYGEIGRDFMEVHHERPVCQYEEEGMELFAAEAVKKMKPLCANCHRMIHRNPKKPLSIAELRQVLRED